MTISKTWNFRGGLHMEYTNEMYEEDRKLALYTINHYFKKYSRYKDDLLQVCLINAKRVRELYEETKGKYIHYAIIWFKGKIIRFLENERKINNLGYDASLEAEFNNGEGTLQDVLGYEQEFMENYDYNKLKQMVEEIILKPRLKKIDELKNARHRKNRPDKTKIKTEQKHAIEYFINGKTIQQIANEKGVTKQAVSKAVEKYKKILQEELQKRGYNQ